MKIVGYKTVNKLNSKFYFGVRTLRKDNDPYLGSGLRLKDAIRKYGKDNFERIDLVEFKSFNEALEWEKKIITPELIKNINCYNLKPGGAGGSLPWTKERKEKVKRNGDYKKSNKTIEILRQIAIDRFTDSPGTFTGKTHSQDSKDLMSSKRKGIPGKNKGKKLNLSDDRLAELRKPKSEEVRKKISRALCKLTDEQIRFLKEDFVDLYGERSKLARKWDISLDQISRIIGKRKKNREV